MSLYFASLFLQQLFCCSSKSWTLPLDRSANWSIDSHHDFAKLELASSNVLHQHLEGRQAEFGGQRVERLLLDLLQLHPLPQLLHQLHPQTSLVVWETTATHLLLSAWRLCLHPVRHTALPLSFLWTLLHHLTQSLCFSASSSAVDLSSRASSEEIFFSIWVAQNKCQTFGCSCFWIPVVHLKVIQSWWKYSKSAIHRSSLAEPEILCNSEWVKILSVDLQSWRRQTQKLLLSLEILRKVI